MIFNGKRRFFFGFLLLLLALLCRVYCMEATRNIVNKEAHYRPFIFIYINSSFFVIFLFGFAFNVLRKLFTLNPLEVVSGNSSDAVRSNHSLQCSLNSDSSSHCSSQLLPTFIQDAQCELQSPSSIPIIQNSLLSHNVQADIPSVLPSILLTFSQSGNNELSKPYLEPVKFESTTISQIHEDQGKQNREVKFSNSSEVRVLPANELEYATYARLSHTRTEEFLRTHVRRMLHRHADQLSGANGSQKLDCSPSSLSTSSSDSAASAIRVHSFRSTLRLAADFSLTWYCAFVLYQLALFYINSDLVNSFFSFTAIMTFLMTGLWPATFHDRFNLSKLIAVILCISGSVLIGIGHNYTEQEDHFHAVQSSFSHASVIPQLLNSHSKSSARTRTDYSHLKQDLSWQSVTGVIFSLFSAFAISFSVVSLKRKLYESHQQLNYFMFFGFVGLFIFCFGWPVPLVFQLTHIERVETIFSNESFSWTVLLTNCLVDFVADAMWIIGTFLTSSLLGVLYFSLANPLYILINSCFSPKSIYRFHFFVGLALLLISFIMIALISLFESFKSTRFAESNLKQDNCDCAGECQCDASVGPTEWEASESVVSHTATTSYDSNDSEHMSVQSGDLSSAYASNFTNVDPILSFLTKVFHS